MDRIDSQDRLDLIIANKVGFLRNAGTSANRSTWHRVATLRPEQGFCGTSIMVVRSGGYTKYFVPTEEEIPTDERHCPFCWSDE
jgi:hypothetical protein